MTGRVLLTEGSLLAPWFILYELEKELERARRHERPLSVVLLTPVPTLPSELNDAVFDVAAAAARNAARSTDHIGWLQHKRILIIMPETDRDGAAAAVFRWRSEMSFHGRLNVVRWDVTKTMDPCGFASADELVGNLTGESATLRAA